MPAPEPIPDLLKAVNEASGKAFALWITFLTVGLYLAIAIGTTTHLQLLLAGPVKLPLLGVDMPLFAFYGVAPPLFLVLHLYVLMQLYLLARLLRLFDDDLRAADMIEQDRRRVRGQLDKFVFTQFLIGAPQDAIVGVFLRVVVWLSFVVGPIILLIGFQLRFLPYHSIPVTYAHRVALLLDLALLLLLWPKASATCPQPGKPARSSARMFCRTGLVVSITILLVVFSWFIAIVPGEQAERFELRQEIQMYAVEKLYPEDILDNLGGDTGDPPDIFTRRLFSQSLNLPGERLVEPDEEKLKKLEVTLLLSGGRDLREAKFMSTDLRKADLRGADLSRAVLSFARLSGARLSGAKLLDASLMGTDLGDAGLQSVLLAHANLIGANLRNADLRGAILYSANLSDADLNGALNLTQDQLDEACGIGTKLPKGFTLKPCRRGAVR